MAKNISMDFAAMEKLSSALRQSAIDLEDLIETFRTISNLIEDGALNGQTGNALAESLNSGLTPSVFRLAERLQKLSRDVQREQEMMLDASTE